jgi:hypothetical protein
MSDIYQIIESALEDRLNNITDIPLVAYENVSFSKDSNTTFIEPVFIPTIREPAVRGENPSQYYQGLYRIEINTPSGIGKGEANTIASSIIAAFEATTDITYGGEIISIRYVNKEAGANGGTFWQLPVNIGWYIYK